MPELNDHEVGGDSDRVGSTRANRSVTLSSMQKAIVQYLHRSGWVAQSVQAVLPELPRWERRLRDRGVMYVPLLPSRSWSWAESQAHNELNLLMRQASMIRDPSLEHQLRNLTGVRAFKL